MAYVVPRGRRFTGMYRNREGRRVSAGTYDTYARAEEVAQEAEAFAQSDGKLLDPVVRATTTIEDFAEVFLRHHEVGATTRRTYRGQLHKHVIPAMGHYRIAELTTREVRVWLTELREARTSADHQKRMRDLLSAMMNVAIMMDYRSTNPCRGLKTPRRKGGKEIAVMTVEQFKAVHQCLPTEAGKVMCRLTVATGMRFGEITALTVADLDFSTGVLNICKANTEPGYEESSSGSRYEVNDWTKGGYQRKIRVDRPTVDAVHQYVLTHGLKPHDLLFPQRLLIPATTRPRNRPPLTPERICELGTFMAANGRTYRHGTVNGYATGKCKCEGCRQASSEYSVQRRAARRGRSSPPITSAAAPDRDPAGANGPCGRHDWGRIWKAAVKQSGIGMAPTAYQLRHTHASWLIEAGEDPKTVMKRLGHHNLATFSLYVHTVEENDDVLDTMSNLLGELGTQG